MIVSIHIETKDFPGAQKVTSADLNRAISRILQRVAFDIGQTRGSLVNYSAQVKAENNLIVGIVEIK